MLSIGVDSIESTQIISPVVDSICRKSICEMRLRANRVKSLVASDESTQFGCIGHGWRHLIRKTPLKFRSSRRRETGPPQVVDDKTTEFLVHACAVTFTLLWVAILRSSSWLRKLPTIISLRLHSPKMYQDSPPHNYFQR